MGDNSQVDMSIVDGSNHRNVYQNKRNIKGETRMAITTHADADLGVCFKSLLDHCELASSAGDTAYTANWLRAQLRPSHQRTIFNVP